MSLEPEWNALGRQDLHLLAFANIPRPPPQPWQDVFALLRRGVSRFAASASARAQPAVAGAASGLDLEWYTGVMARMHVNAFRRAPGVFRFLGFSRRSRALRPGWTWSGTRASWRSCASRPSGEPLEVWDLQVLDIRV